MHGSPNRVPCFLFYFSTVSKVLRQKEKFLYPNDGSQSPVKQTKGKPLNNSKIRKDAQLQKKRANDRKAQRAIRERRKKLEQQVPELTEGKKELERQVTELAEGKEQLEAQIAALQCQVTHMSLLLQDRESLMGPEYTERLNNALQRISELEAQMAALQQITAQADGTSPCILHSAPRPGR